MSTRRDAEVAEQRRIRDEIARLRRRLDRRVDRIVDRALLFGSWRDYVVSHPARSLAAAAGVGLAVAGLTPNWTPQSGRRLYDAALSASWPQIWRELQRLIIARSASEATEQGGGQRA